MKLSIIIPYYKIDFFSQTLESLKNQTNKNFIVYIGNDGSKENPIEIINRYKLSLNIKYIEFKDNLGAKSLSSHWNRCIGEIEKPEWGIILGDDDVLGDNCVANFYDSIGEVIKGKLGVIRFASKIIDSGGNTISKIHTHNLKENSVEFIMKKIFERNRSSLSEHVFNLNNSVFKHFPLAWHSDDLALLEYSNFGEIYSINSSVVSIRKSKLNISSKTDLYKIKNIASFHFYNYLFEYRSEYFDDAQKSLLFDKYEKCILNDKRNLKLILVLTATYVKNGMYFQYLQFWKLFLINLFYEKWRKPSKI